MMSKFYTLVDSEPVILLDGAMGTMLLAAGLQGGTSPEAWNVNRPDIVREVHRAYIQAGSRIILTNTFGGSRFRLVRHNEEDRVNEFNKAAAQNARAEADAAERLVLVAGSIGPTGELMKPIGKMTFEEAKAAFTEQAAALEEGGVDLFWVETMSDLNEVRAAVEAVQSVSDLPVVATMTFDANGRTMMGVKPEKAIEALVDLGLAAIGGNCGNGPDEIEGVIERMRETNPGALLVAKANAGLPKMVDGEVKYDGAPEVMAEYAQAAHKLGARFIGACCGSSPDHVRAMAEALGLPLGG
jgi:5-methyltetrahydrofolate--homocysteine methyltransferase